MAFDPGKYFMEDSTTYQDKGVVVYRFRDDLLDEFISDFILPFRLAYVNTEEIVSGVEHGYWSRKQGIANQLPTTPMIKSGEFSEILVYFLSLCFRCPDVNVYPLKWLWKENPNTPMHLSDIAMAKCEDCHNPSEDDYLYFVESKAGATPLPKVTSKSVMNDGILGALDDIVSRASKMVTFLIVKFNKEKNYEMADRMNRFQETVKVKYQRRFNAAIVVDSKSLDQHINNTTQENLDKARRLGVELFAIPIAHMKDVYERVLVEAQNT